MSALRLFVGVFPPPSLIEGLSGAMTTWKSLLDDDRVKWSPADNLHLTLCFLGQVDASRLAELEACLAETSCEPAVDLTMRGLGVFPNHQRPRVVWAGVQGDVAGLEKIRHAVQRAGAPFLEKPESKPFSPHLTLARIKDADGRLSRAVRRLAQEHADQQFGSWRVDRIQLMASRTDSDRSRYQELLSVPLREGS